MTDTADPNPAPVLTLHAAAAVLRRLVHAWDDHDAVDGDAFFAALRDARQLLGMTQPAEPEGEP